MNRLDDAKAAFDQALARKLDGGYLRLYLHYLAFLRGDSVQMKQQVAWGAGKPGDEDLLLSTQSDSDAYYGRLAKARDFSRRAVDSAVRSDCKETAALWEANAALREAEFGKFEEVLQKWGRTWGNLRCVGADRKPLGALHTENLLTHC